MHYPHAEILTGTQADHATIPQLCINFARPQENGERVHLQMLCPACLSQHSTSNSSMFTWSPQISRPCTFCKHASKPAIPHILLGPQHHSQGCAHILTRLVLLQLPALLFCLKPQYPVCKHAARALNWYISYGNRACCNSAGQGKVGTIYS